MLGNMEFLAIFVGSLASGLIVVHILQPRLVRWINKRPSWVHRINGPRAKIVGTDDIGGKIVGTYAVIWLVGWLAFFGANTHYPPDSGGSVGPQVSPVPTDPPTFTP